MKKYWNYVTNITVFSLMMHWALQSLSILPQGQFHLLNSGLIQHLLRSCLLRSCLLQSCPILRSFLLLLPYGQVLILILPDEA